MSRNAPAIRHQFGGPWTEQKLTVLRKYLTAYQTIFKVNLRAKHFNTVYVDAFAGTGTRTPPQSEQQQALIADEAAIRKGSVRVALELPLKFDSYVFIEERRTFVSELERMVASEFPDLQSKCSINRADANAYLADWCRAKDWKSTRAVAFLDPYRMTVEWPLVEALAKTGGVDLWVLVPVGVGIHRILTRDGLPSPVWGKRLTRFFGTPDWVSAFYRRRSNADLFAEDSEMIEKTATTSAISDFFNSRLKNVFPYVADKPGVLLNSRKNPLFLFHFASHNATGLKIARDILRRW